MVVRYHPVFLNPNVPKVTDRVWRDVEGCGGMWRDGTEGCNESIPAQEGENLDDYLFREFGYSKEPNEARDHTTIHSTRQD